MSKFNTRGHQARPAVVHATSPLATTSHAAPDSRTYEGAPAWKRDKRTDLFLRATASFGGGEGTFYESGDKRDATLRELARQVAVEDFDWFAQFVEWLRRTANIRTAALTIAADGVKARLDAGLQAPVNSVMPTNREVIDSVLYRADEPGEMLAYWTATYGSRIPKPVKRGVADAVQRLYNERSLLKYDTASHSFRFADVLNLVHVAPDPAKPWQGGLFQYALDRRHNPDTAVPAEHLTMLHVNKQLRSSTDPKDWLDADQLSHAGMAWEDALSAVGSKVDKAKLWESMIPSMGFMAQLRNLRNFDEAGVSNEVAGQVIARLQDRDEVAKSRQLPFRFYSAYKNAPSLRWAQALEMALDLCLPNVSRLPGRTLVLIDSSGSMQARMSGKSTFSCVEAAALFGSAVALRNVGDVDLYHFADRHVRVDVPRGGSALKLTQHIVGRVGEVGYGTNIGPSVRATYSGHDRVLIFSDGMTFDRYGGRNIAASVPADVPVYLFNLVGYSQSPMPTGEAARFDLGGLTDHTFALINQLEVGRNGVWPWEAAA